MPLRTGIIIMGILLMLLAVSLAANGQGIINERSGTFGGSASRTGDQWCETERSGCYAQQSKAPADQRATGYGSICEQNFKSCMAGRGRTFDTYPRQAR